MNRHFVAMTLTGTLALTACTKPTAPQTTEAAPSSAAPSLRHPTSLNAIMVGAVDHASDPLFEVGNAVMGSGKLPTTEEDWRQVQYHAYQMVVLGTAMQIPGTGPKDVAWTSTPSWKVWSEQLSGIGMEMLQLVEKKDAQGFVNAGDRLVAACEGCHKEFKPEIPTMNILHRPMFNGGTEKK
jgi:hypothetical protein